MTEPIHDYDPADSLIDSEAVAVFLADAHDTGDAAYIADAIAIVARAKIRFDVEGMTVLDADTAYQLLDNPPEPNEALRRLLSLR